MRTALLCRALLCRPPPTLLLRSSLPVHLSRRCSHLLNPSFSRSTSTSTSPPLSSSPPPASSTSSSPSPSTSSPPPPYPRDPRFSTLTPSDISHFTSLLGPDGVRTDPDDLRSASTDWMKKYRGHASVLLRPSSTQQVAAVLAHCHARRLAVVPQGGNTGLVGGSVPVYDEVVLSLSRMNRILDFDGHAGIVTCEAGVVLEQLAQWLEGRGFIVPLDLGAKGTCQIGGNVSTNAGGLRLVRYGSLHGSVLGLEVVTATGQVLDLTSTLRKDNTGYDLKQLFIGAEGTLGVITRVNLITPRRPTSVQLAVLALDSFPAVLSTMISARHHLSDILSAIEFFDRPSLDLVVKHIPGSRDPLDSAHPFYMLIETSGTNATHDAEKLAAFLEREMTGGGEGGGDEGGVKDGVIAQDESQQKALWVLRETITDALGREGTVYKYDISVPVTHFYELVEAMRERLRPVKKEGVGVVGYGHLGDSNLHLNIHSKGYHREVFERIEPWLFEQVKAVRGSISAEHGLGQSKTKYIHYSKSDEAVELMRKFKDLMDPQGILNPYKVTPPVQQQAHA